MKTSLLICATCLLITGCSAQLRFPSLSSALSSWTGLGGSSSGSQASSGVSSSPYSGLVRDYGRNLMMAMSSIYPTLFKPPQQQLQQNQPSPQSPFEAFGNQFGSQNLFSGQPSFSLGGSTFSISPTLPFGSLSGGGPSQSSQPIASASHSSPFGASFGSSINSPPSFGSLSSSPFMSQSSLPQFAPASSYNAAFEAANGGPSIGSGSPSFDSIRSSSQLQSAASSMIPQSSNSHPSLYSSIPNFSSQHETGSSFGHHSQSPIQPAQQHQLGQQSSLGSHIPSFASQPTSQYNPQSYRPEVMSISASAPISSSNSFSNYGNIPSSPSSQQVSASRNSYQQQQQQPPSFR